MSSSIPLDQVSYYTCLLSLQLSVGNILTFFVILFECVQQLEACLQSSSSATPPKKIDRTYCGIAGLPILDGLHSYQNVLLYSFGLGLVAGVGLKIFVTGATFYTFGSYLFFLALFHNLEVDQIVVPFLIFSIFLQPCIVKMLH